MDSITARQLARILYRRNVAPDYHYASDSNPDYVAVWTLEENNYLVVIRFNLTVDYYIKRTEEVDTNNLRAMMQINT